MDGTQISSYPFRQNRTWERDVIEGRHFPSARLVKHAFSGVVVCFVLLTVTALADNLLRAGWGLGWEVFFIGFVASAWGIMAYQLCASLYGWSKKRS
jgi:hypothetical protein